LNEDQNYSKRVVTHDENKRKRSWWRSDDGDGTNEISYDDDKSEVKAEEEDDRPRRASVICFLSAMRCQ
jgi:hypothetical protein